MKSLVIIALSLLLSGVANAQSDVLDSMNTDRFWKSISVQDYHDQRAGDALPALPPHDVAIVVASNRMTRWGKTRFMGEDRATDHLTYFLAFSTKGKWTLWRTTLKQAIAGIPATDRDWVVYTEGYGKIFTNGLYRGFSMADQHKVNVLYLDYPSYTTAKKILGNYYFALDNAKLAGDDFAPVLDTLKRLRELGRMGTGHLTLFFHSMGNNAIREIARTRRLKEMNDRIWVDNLVLNSACVPEASHVQWLDRIKFASNIYVNYNPKDVTLGGAALVSLTRQLGQGPRSVVSNKAVYVNFNTLCSRNHSNFVHLSQRAAPSTATIAYYHLILHGYAAPVQNTSIFMASSFHDIGYDLICRDAAIMEAYIASPQQPKDAMVQPKTAEQPAASTGVFLQPGDQELQKGASAAAH